MTVPHSADGRSRAVRFAAVCVATTLGCTIVACGRASAPEGMTIRDSLGVELVTVTALPALDDRDLAWSLIPELSVPTQRPDQPPIAFDPRDVIPIAGDTVLVLDDYGDAPFVLLDAGVARVLRRFGARGQGPGEVTDCGRHRERTASRGRCA